MKGGKGAKSLSEATHDWRRRRGRRGGWVGGLLESFVPSFSRRIPAFGPMPLMVCRAALALQHQMRVSDLSRCCG